MVKQVALKDIRIDGNTQQRPVDPTVVAKYKALMQEGDKFPPVEVIFDGHDFWLADGFHRVHAMRKLAQNMVEANVNEGTKRDAIFYSFSANQYHGFPRQPGTIKTMLMEKIFPDDEWGEMTDEQIRLFIGGVSRSYISRCRNEFRGDKPVKKTPETVTVSQSEESVVPETPVTAEQPEVEADLSNVIDSLGQKVPEHLAKTFFRAAEIKEHGKSINLVFRAIKEACDNADPLYKDCKIEALKSDIGNIRRNLRFSLPYCVCKYCGGDVNNADCRACNGTGIQNEQSYIATPAEMK